jgi:pyruvate/2-oxoglutarate dehydrogenase complex dihydrolipoamide dehydrogenase (E3) component
MSKKVFVIGCSLEGLSASIDLLRSGFKVTILEQKDVLIEDSLEFKSLLQKAKSKGVIILLRQNARRILVDKFLRVESVLTDLREYCCYYIISCLGRTETITALLKEKNFIDIHPQRIRSFKYHKLYFCRMPEGDEQGKVEQGKTVAQKLIFDENLFGKFKIY